MKKHNFVTVIWSDKVRQCAGRVRTNQRHCLSAVAPASCAACRICVVLCRTFKSHSAVDADCLVTFCGAGKWHMLALVCRTCKACACLVHEAVLACVLEDALFCARLCSMYSRQLAFDRFVAASYYLLQGVWQHCAACVASVDDLVAGFVWVIFYGSVPEVACF